MVQTPGLNQELNQKEGTKMSKVLPQYSTIKFTEVWDDVSKFKTDLARSPFAGSIHYGEAIPKKPDEPPKPDEPTNYPDNVTLVYYLLYARYGNNPIANEDVTQWKYKIFSVIFQYGPTWEKKLDIQEKLRDIKDDDLLIGSKAIYNSAVNPSTAPSTNSLQELKYINGQNVTNYKKSQMDAYTQLLGLLEVDVTEDFLNKFKKCFKVFVAPERPLLYVSDEAEDDE